DIICHQYQSFVEKWERLHQGLKKLRSGFSAKHFQNSAANLEVMLLKIKQQLDDCKSWESFQFYSENIEQDLASASAALQELENGKNPFEHQTGTFMRGYYSEIDGSLQGYALHVPDTYRGETSFPLVLNLHGFDPSYSPWWENIFLSVFMPHATAHQRYILVNPFGRGNTIYQNIGEHDVLQVFAEVKRLYHIDENRIYLTGGSMGGAGVWNIGLKYPDLFAALAPIMGPTEFNFWIGAPTEKLPSFRSFLYQKRSALSFAENALQLPVLCHHGVMDDIVPIEQSRKMVSRFHELGYAIRYVEHPQAAHGGFEPEMEQSIYDWFQDHEKNPNPSRVKVKAGALDQAKAYWIEIEKFIKLNEFAIVDAEITAQNSFDIKTENVARFRLFLNDYLVDGQQPLLFRIDGQTYDDFQLPSDKKVFCSSVLDSNDLVSGWKINPPPQKQFSKKRGLAGPILDVFNHSFLIVYGTSGTTEENQVNFDEAMRFVEQWQAWQHVPCRVKKDIDLTETDLKNFHLILIGNASSNAILKRINSQLPIRLDVNSIIFDEKIYYGEDLGLAMIYPNPLTSDKYVVILAGVTEKGTRLITRRIGTEFDFLIFDSKTIGINLHQGNLTIDGTPLVYGLFDNNWQISTEYQLHADSNLRQKIKPIRTDIDTRANRESDIVYLSDLKPNQVDLWTGFVELDRNCWGNRFEVDQKKHEKGISVLPNAKLVYQNQGKWNRFAAIFSVDQNPFPGWSDGEIRCGKIQLGVYGDDQELYLSPAMDYLSDPVKIDLAITGVEELKFVFRTTEWLPCFYQCANIIDAKMYGLAE
ncbi:MAG TPA: hypothetical protein ENN22_04530, partial [bacterium]|nr:hypothetical protein [bacterium]